MASWLVGEGAWITEAHHVQARKLNQTSSNSASTSVITFYLIAVLLTVHSWPVSFSTNPPNTLCSTRGEPFPPLRLQDYGPYQRRPMTAETGNQIGNCVTRCSGRPSGVSIIQSIERVQDVQGSWAVRSSPSSDGLPFWRSLPSQ
jgi:hypothetical protein